MDPMSNLQIENKVSPSELQLAMHHTFCRMDFLYFQIARQMCILAYFQRGRQDFFRGGGGRSGHLKAITRPPQGVRGAKAPRTVAKFHFLNYSKYLKTNPFFNNSNILPEKSIFSKKNFEKLNIFYKNF